MKPIILIALIIQMSEASTLSMKQVLSSANKNNALTQAVDKERLFLEARNLADTSSDPMDLVATGSKVYPIVGEKDYEYSVGLLKKLPWGDTQEKDQMINRLNNEAYLLDEDKKILNFENGLKNLYHQHCLDYKNYYSFKQNYDDFTKLYKKKQKAYKYQEISKTELMQLEIEKNRLYAQLKEIQMVQNTSKKKLLILGRINHSSKTKLSCSDLYPIRENITLKYNVFDLTKQAYQKRTQSTQVALERYSKAIDSISLAVQYDKEIDLDKYSIGVSIPLAFSSQRAEQERAAAMYKNSALDYHHEQTMLEKKSIFLELKSTLKSRVQTINSLKKNIHAYKTDLLPLIQKSYDLGESSVIEYLLNRQRYHQLKQTFFSTQKAYYQTLFTLYTLSETKDIK